MNRLFSCTTFGLSVLLAIGAACHGQYEGSLPPGAGPGLQPVAEPVPGGLPLPARRYVSSSDRRLPPYCSPSTCNGQGGADGCYRTRISRAWHTRIKPHLQKSHWGYCNCFDERPFGDALGVAMRRQIHRGSVNMLMLYYYDFHPRGSQRAAELTSRGEVQLLKMVYRMQATPGPIVVQIDDDDHELNERRRLHVVEALAALGVDAADQFVVLGRQRFGTPAAEAVEHAGGLMEAVRSRGRTLRAAESPSFGGSVSSGFRN